MICGGIGSEKRGILEPRMSELPNAMLFGSHATLFGSDATLFQFWIPRFWVPPGHCIKIVFWSYLWNKLVNLENLSTVFLRMLRSIYEKKFSMKAQSPFKGGRRGVSYKKNSPTF